MRPVLCAVVAAAVGVSACSQDDGLTCAPAQVVIPGGVVRELIAVPNDASIDLDVGGLLPTGAVLAFEDASGEPVAGTFTPGAATYAARLHSAVAPGTIGFISIDDGCGATVWSRPFVARVEEDLGIT